MRMIVILALAATFAQAEIRQVKPALHLLPPVPPQQTLAQRIEARARRAAMAERAKAMRELAGVSTNAADSVVISNQVSVIRERAWMLRGLSVVVSDTRSNIVEAADLTDAEIACLYIAQMAKEAPDLIAVARTNTIEHIIGAGMRQDLHGRNK